MQVPPLVLLPLLLLAQWVFPHITGGWGWGRGAPEPVWMGSTASPLTLVLSFSALGGRLGEHGVHLPEPLPGPHRCE